MSSLGVSGSESLQFEPGYSKLCSDTELRKEHKKASKQAHRPRKSDHQVVEAATVTDAAHNILLQLHHVVPSPANHKQQQQ
jgi:hypothetical protein